MAVSQEEEDYLANLRKQQGLPPDPNAGNNAPTGPADQRNSDTAIYNTGVSSDANRPSGPQVVQLPNAGSSGGVASNANPWVATKDGNPQVNAYLNPYFQAAPGTYDYANSSGTAMSAEQARLGTETAPHAAGTVLGPMAQAQGTQLDPSQQAQFRGQQMQLGQALQAQANGQGPSVAGSQLQQSTEQNLQAALAQAASSRGGNLGAAQYALGNARANIQQQAAQGLAQTRIQEQMAARSQLGDVLNAGRGSDINMSAQNAQLGQQNNQFNAGQTNTGALAQGAMTQQTSLANAGADQQQQARVDELTSKYLAAGMSMEQAQQQARIQAEQFRINTASGLYGLERGVAQTAQTAQNAQNAQLVGGIFQTVGSVGAALAK